MRPAALHKIPVLAAAAIAAVVLAGPGGLTLARAQNAAPGAPPNVQAAPPLSPQEQELERLKDEGKGAALKEDYPAAIRVWETGLQKAQTAGDTRRVTVFLFNLGLAHYHLGQYDQAIDCHSRALDLAAAAGNQQTIARCLTALANSYDEQGRYDKALELHLRSVELSEKASDRHSLAIALNNLGAVYDDLGQYQKAVDAHTRSLGLCEALGDLANAANNQENLGLVFSHLGQYDRAVEYLSRALSTFESLGRETSIAKCLTNLGMTYSSLGQDERAIGYLGRALVIKERVGNPHLIVTTLHDLGNAYSNLGEFQKALDAMNRAAGLLKNVDDPPLQTSNLLFTGTVYSDMGDPQKALDYHSRAMQVIEKAGNGEDVADALNSLGLDYYHLRQFDKAIDCHSRAADAYEQIENQHYSAYSLVCLGNACMEQGDLDRAEACYARAVAHLESVGEQVGEAGRIGQLQETVPGLYAQYASLFVRRGRPKEALAMLERGRAQGLARQMAENRKSLASYLSKADAGRLLEATDRLTAAERLRRAAEEQAADAGPHQAAADRQLSAARQAYDDALCTYGIVREGLLAAYPAYRRVTGEQPPTPARLQDLARAHPDTLYLEYAAVDEEAALLFALSARDGLHVLMLQAGARELAQSVRAWRRALVQARLTEPREAAALYTALIAPLEKAGILKPQTPAGGYARLVIVPDGPLLDIPFAALMDGGGKRLIERFAVSTALSLGVLDWPRTQRSPAASLLCVADPIGPAVAVQSVALRGGLGPLTFARAEERAIAGLIPGAVSLVGPQAREATVKREMGRYALLHFATHGLLDKRDGLGSSLLLAPEPQGSSEDGVLEAREIMDLPLAARLAVLSGCATGRGERGGGEGLLGLAWAFQAAGCPSVVASQWSVDDAATERLMEAFYRALRAGRRKDDALRAAMLAAREWSRQQRGRDVPFYWSAFQLIGDASPVSLPAPTAHR